MKEYSRGFHLAAAGSESISQEIPLSQIHVLKRASRRRTSSLESDSDQSVRHAGVVDTLARAKNSAECRRIIETLLRVMDLSFFAYFAIEKMRNDPPHLYLHDAFFPAQCISNGEYKENSDPDLRILAQWASRMPIIWDIKQLRGVYCQDEAKGEFLDLMMVMKELDIRSGIMLPINISGGSLRAYACFGAHRAVNHWIASELMEQSLSIGLSVHRFVLPQLRTVVEKNSKNILDQFERELLLGVVEGASDKMIARRLRTSAYNVDYHLRKMRKRFGATNRIHLAYSVSNLGLL